MGSLFSIVDDRDSTIQYTGPWDHSMGRSQEFRGTNSRPLAAGARMTYKFKGLQISVYATVGLGDPTTVTFFIDGVQKSSLTTSKVASANDINEFHKEFFTITNLPDAEHTLVMQTDSPTSNANFYFDFLIWSPGKNPAIAGLYFIDDTSFQYSGATTTSGPVGTTELDNYLGTIHNMNFHSVATLGFVGQRIQIFGTVPNRVILDSVTVATFQMDGGPKQSVKWPPSSLFQGAGLHNDAVSNYQWWDSGTISNDNHTLIITSNVDDGFFLDYALDTFSTPTFIDSVASALPASPGASSTAGSTGVGSITQTGSISQGFTVSGSRTISLSRTGTITATDAASVSASSSGLPDPSVSGSASSSPQNGGTTVVSNQNNIGSVVGGVLGGIALSVSVVILWIVLRRKTKRREANYEITRLQDMDSSSSAYLNANNGGNSMSAATGWRTSSSQNRDSSTHTDVYPLGAPAGSKAAQSRLSSPTTRPLSQESNSTIPMYDGAPPSYLAPGH